MNKSVTINKVLFILKDELKHYAFIAFSLDVGYTVNVGFVTSHMELTNEKVLESKIKLSEIVRGNLALNIINKFLNIDPVVGMSNIQTINTVILPSAIISDGKTFCMYHKSLSIVDNDIVYNCNTKADPEIETYPMLDKPIIAKLIGNNYNFIIYELAPSFEIVYKG